MENPQPGVSDLFHDESVSEIECDEKSDDNEGPLCSLKKMDSISKSLINNVDLKREAIKNLKEICDKQQQNIQQIQLKYEEVNVKLKQIPQDEQVANERYEEAMEKAKDLQNKQCQINEKLEFFFKIYDYATEVFQSTTECFCEGKEAGKQRQLIYEQDLLEIINKGEVFEKSFEDSIKRKRVLIEKSENYLKKINLNVEEKQIREIKEKAKDMSVNNDKLKIEINELELKLDESRKELDLIKDSFDEDKLRIINAIKHYKELIQNEENFLNDCRLQIQELAEKKNFLTSSNVQLKDEIADKELTIRRLKEKNSCEKDSLEELFLQVQKKRETLPELQTVKKLHQEKVASIKKLTEQLNEHEHQLKSYEALSEEFSGNLYKLKSRIELKRLELNATNKQCEDLKESIRRFRSDVEALELKAHENEKTTENKKCEILHKINLMSEEDNNIVNQITILEGQIGGKNAYCENMKREIVLKKFELQEISTKLTKLKNTVAEGDVNLSSEQLIYITTCARTEEQLELLKAHCCQANIIKDQIEFEKSRNDRMQEDFKQKCEDMVKTYNTQIDFNLKEFERLKLDLSMKEEKHNDECSKVSFKYHSLKNECKNVHEDLQRLESLIKRCEAEYVMMNSFKDLMIKKFAPNRIDESGSDDFDGQVDSTMKSTRILTSEDRPRQELSTHEAEVSSSLDDSSLDIPIEEFKLRSQPSRANHNLLRQHNKSSRGFHEILHITLDSSDTEIACSSSTNIKKNLKVYPPSQRKQSKYKSIKKKISTTRTILDSLESS